MPLKSVTNAGTPFRAGSKGLWPFLTQVARDASDASSRGSGTFLFFFIYSTNDHLQVEYAE